MRRRCLAQRAHVRVYQNEKYEHYEYDHMYGGHYAYTTRHLDPALKTCDIPQHEARDESDWCGDEHYQLVSQPLHWVELVVRTYVMWATLSLEDAVTVVAGLLEEVAEKMLCIQYRMIVRDPI